MLHSIRALVLLATAAIGCFRFSEDPARTFEAGVDATVSDTAADTPPTMCDRYGYATVEGAMAALIPKLQADCRIQRFFGAMPPAALAHMQECMALQVGSIMRCSRGGVRIKYPGLDSKGILCRDMRGSHQSLGIHAEDFDAMMDDVLAVLSDAKISADDLAAIGDVLRFQRGDIVNPGDAGRGDACVADSGAAPTDTGSEY